jgi:hypothetical protein
MTRNVVYIRVLLVIVAIAVILTFINRSPQRAQGDSWLPSSFNPVGAGHMAFYQTLQELNWPVDRWREPLSRLSDYGAGNVLIIARAQTGARVNFSDQELDLLEAWVSKGNTLLLIGALNDWDDTRDFLQRINFILPDKPDGVADFLHPFATSKVEPFEAQPVPGNPISGTLVLPRNTSLFPILPPNARTLWQVDGAPYLIDTPLGAGHVICGFSAQLLSNTWLQRGDNLPIVLRLLQPSGHLPNHIFFEESHHGYSSSYALALLLGHPGVGFAGMLALLGVLTYFGSSLVRFGPVVPLQRETGRSSLEFIDSIADLYIRADVRNETIQYLFKETHQRVLQRLNLPPTASHELIATRLQLAHPHLPRWKKLAQRFDSTDYTDGLPPTGWLRVARELIEIKSAMA